METRRGTKRTPQAETGTRSVKKKEIYPKLDLVVITNMEPFQLEHYWSPEYQEKFKSADIFGSLQLSQT